MGKTTLKTLAKVIKASADANRIRILSMLKQKKMCVCEIAFVLGISQPSVSRHLKKLRSLGFIEAESAGLWTNYYLCPKNRYSGDFIKNLPVWLDTDAMVIADKKKMDKADRGKLCCP